MTASPREISSTGDPKMPGQSLAVLAETLYLANLMLLPGIAFAAIALLWFKHKNDAPPLAAQHLRQTFFVSLYGGILLVAFCVLILALGGTHWSGTWVLVILYFTCVHSTLILFGILGLARAMAGKTFRYPLIGPRG